MMGLKWTFPQKEDNWDARESINPVILRRTLSIMRVIKHSTNADASPCLRGKFGAA